MSERKETPQNESRQFPPLYEKGVPIALGVIVVLIVVMLLVSFAVATGLLQAG